MRYRIPQVKMLEGSIELLISILLLPHDRSSAILENLASRKDNVCPGDNYSYNRGCGKGSLDFSIENHVQNSVEKDAERKCICEKIRKFPRGLRFVG